MRYHLTSVEVIYVHKAGFTRRNRILNAVKKGNCEVQISWHCLEAEIIRYPTVWAILPTHFDAALSRMSLILISNHALLKLQSHQHQNPVEATVAARRAWYEKKLLCVLSDMNSCTNTSLKVRKVLISSLIMWSDIITWQRRPESKCCWMTGNQFKKLTFYLPVVQIKEMP